MIQRLLGQRRVENRRKKPRRTDDEGYFSTSDTYMLVAGHNS